MSTPTAFQASKILPISTHAMPPSQTWWTLCEQDNRVAVMKDDKPTFIKDVRVVLGSESGTVGSCIGCGEEKVRDGALGKLSI
ncbi:hypothetical protein I4I80_02710 [Pseudomonas syringae pv. tomato]|nr:hypothetical protein [Pseudomonas syringae pv. tomato]MBW8023654.1 hypothetical protein [Pseudomonas syringae pv. tomato]